MFLIKNITARDIASSQNCELSGTDGAIQLKPGATIGSVTTVKYHPRYAEQYRGFEVQPSEVGIKANLLGTLSRTYYWDGL